MKKLLSALMTVGLILVSIKAFADYTLKKDGASPPLGRFEELNIKTGGSGQVTTSGETATLDETNVTGVNWSALNSTGGTVNWNGANINPVTGINWYNFPAATNGVNWGGIQINNSAINWNDVQLAQQNFPQNTGINWNSLNTQSGGVNWTALGGQAVQGELMCWNMARGFPGHCVALSGVICTSCD